MFGENSDLSTKFPTDRYMRLKSDPYTSDVEVRIEESRCALQLHNYATAIVTKLIITDGKVIVQKFRSAGGSDTYIGEAVLGEVK